MPADLSQQPLISRSASSDKCPWAALPQCHGSISSSRALAQVFCFCSLGEQAPSDPASPLSPRGVGIELKCRCPPLGSISFIFMMNKLSKFDKSCCHSHISFVFVLSKSYKDSASFTSASEDCGKQKSTLASSCVTNYIFWQRFYRLHMSRLNFAVNCAIEGWTTGSEAALHTRSDQARN